MLQTFICKAEGNMLGEFDESINIRWIETSELKKLLEEDESIFYPMHINAIKKYIKLKLNV